ncbi:MAG TPA: hypothetical protein ENI42_02655, partial [Thermoplasmatales archaeon]|nr:hypothetical protein [Thermoplasmatales archaeon]
MKNVYQNLVKDYLEIVNGYLVRENIEVQDRKEKKILSLNVVAVKPEEGEVLLGKITPFPLDSEGIEKIWGDKFTQEMKRLIFEEIHYKNPAHLRKTVYCKPPQVEDKDINRVKSKIRETAGKRNINVVFFDEILQQIIDYCAEHKVPVTAETISVVSIIEA